MVRLMNIVYYMLAGLLCVAYYILVHDYLSTSVKKGRLLKSSLLTIGIQVLLIFLIHLGLLVYGYYQIDKIWILIILVEGLLGAGMLIFALRKKKLST